MMLFFLKQTFLKSYCVLKIERVSILNKAIVLHSVCITKHPSMHRFQLIFGVHSVRVFIKIFN